MSNLLDVMKPFRKNMDRFITLYEKVNTILDVIQSPGFGQEVTQEDYFLAAEEAGLSPLQAEELLKDDFVNICRKLIGENEEGSIQNIIHVMDDEDQFTFITDDGLIEDRYAELQFKFERHLYDLEKDLTDFLDNVDDGSESGVFVAPGDVRPYVVTKAIEHYNNFIKFLKEEANRENPDSAGKRKTRRLKKSKRGKKSKQHKKSKKSKKPKKPKKPKKTRKTKKK